MKYKALEKILALLLFAAFLCAICTACQVETPEPEPEPPVIVEPQPEVPAVIDHSGSPIAPIEEISEEDQAQYYTVYFEDEVYFESPWDAFGLSGNQYIYDEKENIFSCTALEHEEVNIIILRERVTAWTGFKGQLYCALENGRILRMDMDGQNKQVICEDTGGGEITHIYTNGELIYFRKDREIYRFLIRTEKVEHVYTIQNELFDTEPGASFIPFTNWSFLWAEPTLPSSALQNERNYDQRYYLHMYDIYNRREVNIQQIYLGAIADHCTEENYIRYFYFR